MTGKDIFAAVGSEPNVEIRFYNTPNLLKPWTINGCLHDKYIVADHKYLLMGGRNMFDYFPWNTQRKKQRYRQGDSDRQSRIKRSRCSRTDQKIFSKSLELRSLQNKI